MSGIQPRGLIQAGAEATSLVTPEETQYSQQDKLEVLLGPAQLSYATALAE